MFGKPRSRVPWPPLSWEAATHLLHKMLVLKQHNLSMSTPSVAIAILTIRDGYSGVNVQMEVCVILY